jgi:hypothetical protein
MGGRPLPEIPCTLCGKSVNLQFDLSGDETGKAVHEQCYVRRIAASLGNPLSTGMAD